MHIKQKQRLQLNYQVKQTCETECEFVIQGILSRTGRSNVLRTSVASNVSVLMWAILISWLHNWANCWAETFPGVEHCIQVDCNELNELVRTDTWWQYQWRKVCQDLLHVRSCLCQLWTPRHNTTFSAGHSHIHHPLTHTLLLFVNKATSLSTFSTFMHSCSTSQMMPDAKQKFSIHLILDIQLIIMHAQHTS